MEGMKKILGVESFDKLPTEICPCALTVKTCKRDDTGEVFEIAEAVQEGGDKWFLYKKDNLIAKKLCDILMREAVY
jgi:hypothetical protein